jgi:DsbC/DsbD-like thiol-disulfide interchange protein
MKANTRIQDLLALLISVTLLAGSATAGDKPAAEAGDAKLVDARLLANTTAVAAGKPFHVGVHLRMADGWHVYWRNPGDAGVATEVLWELPEGFSAGPLRWPRPVTFKQPGDIVGYGYKGDVLLTAEITPPEKLPDGRFEIAAKVAWLACADRCIPGEAATALSLPAATADAPAKDANAKLFAAWAQKAPRPAPTFTLTDQAGREVSLGDLRGKPVVLEWFNPDCPFVVRHHRKQNTMATLANKYEPKGVVWLAVNSTHYMDRAKNEQVHAEWDLAYPVLVDQDGTVGRQYEAKTTPHMYVIDPDGLIVYAGGIDDDPRGRNDSPTNYVDAAITALLADKPLAVHEAKPYGCSVKYPPKAK